MRWFQENKHIVAILLLLVSMFWLYKEITSQLSTYREQMRTVDILVEKNSLISKIDEERLLLEVKKLEDVSEKLAILFVPGNQPMYSIKSYLFKYVKSLLNYLGTKEFDSLSISKVANNKNDKMWSVITVVINGIKGPKTYDELVSMFKKIENVDKLIYVTSVNITYNEKDQYPYTISLTMQIPVVVFGGE